MHKRRGWKKKFLSTAHCRLKTAFRSRSERCLQTAVYFSYRGVRSLPAGLDDFGMCPGRAIGTPQQMIGLFVTNYLTGFLIPCQTAPELHGQVRQDTGSGRDVALLDVGHRFTALADSL